MNTKLLLAACLVISLAANVFLGISYLKDQKEIENDKNVIATDVINKKIVNFNRLVIEKVLKAGGEVSFDDRLQLENGVRDTKDEELLAQWNNFTAAKDEPAAQQEMKNLLGLLAQKIASAN